MANYSSGNNFYKLFLSRWYCCKSRAEIYKKLYKTYVPLATLSTQDNAKVFELLTRGLKERLTGIISI